jgi:hypothetical protein
VRRRKVKGKWSRETCYAVTSLTVIQATHAQLAANYYLAVSSACGWSIVVKSG